MYDRLVASKTLETSELVNSLLLHMVDFASTRTSETMSFVLNILGTMDS